MSGDLNDAELKVTGMIFWERQKIVGEHSTQAVVQLLLTMLARFAVMNLRRKWEQKDVEDVQVGDERNITITL